MEGHAVGVQDVHLIDRCIRSVVPAQAHGHASQSTCQHCCLSCSGRHGRTVGAGFPLHQNPW